MSNTNNVALRFKEEWEEGGAGTYGTTATGNYDELRFTSESLETDLTFENSDEIVMDGQVKDVVKVDNQSSGQINGHLSYGTYDLLWEGGLVSADWTSEQTDTGTDISMASADNSINATSTDLSVYAANTWIRTEGFATAANNGVFKVLTSSTTKLTLAGGTVVNETAGPSVTVTGDGEIKNGTTLRSYSVERDYTDLLTADRYVLYNGIVFSGFGLTIPQQGKINVSFNCLGLPETNPGAASSGTPVAANSNAIMTGGVEFVKLMEGGGSSYDTAVAMRTLELNVDPGLRLRKVAGTVGPESVGRGLVAVTGQFTAYFQTKALADKFLGDTITALAFVLTDGANNSYVFEMPQVKFTSGPRPTQGISDDTILTLGFTAYKDPSELTTLRIQRFAA